jgi:hypothetical protein
MRIPVSSSATRDGKGSLRWCVETPWDDRNGGQSEEIRQSAGVQRDRQKEREVTWSAGRVKILTAERDFYLNVNLFMRYFELTLI